MDNEVIRERLTFVRFNLTRSGAVVIAVSADRITNCLGDGVEGLRNVDEVIDSGGRVVKMVRRGPRQGVRSTLLGTDSDSGSSAHAALIFSSGTRVCEIKRSGVLASVAGKAWQSACTCSSCSLRP